ncbi:hypothetical protein [Dokdonella sp.]|uniref:hypothetical protein n=1 Tax=Dokdonella sp. TaxID=2291710 RepID=UPI002F3E27D0
MESAAPTKNAPRVETLGQLVGQFAHDLNNQLAIALASVELATRVDDRDKARQLLTRAVEAIERQRVLLEAMANASAASARPEVCDVHALLEEARMRTPGRIVVKPAAADARVLCDRAFLRDALAHLCGHEPGDGVLTIETSNGFARPSGRGASLVLLVAPVMPPGRVAERAFAPFGDEDNERRLGFAQIHDTVRRIGGRADFEPFTDEACGLRLVLPLAAAVP